MPANAKRTRLLDRSPLTIELTTALTKSINNPIRKTSEPNCLWGAAADKAASKKESSNTPPTKPPSARTSSRMLCG